MNNTDTSRVLLVEDNDIDAMLLQRVLRKVRPEVNVVRCEDGIAALEYLKDSQPELIIMDIRMPRMDGREALAAIKADKNLCSIPIIMMSTSKYEADIAFCYKHFANAYVVKVVDSRESARMIESIVHFWFDTAEITTH